MRECKPQSSLIVARLAGEDLLVHEGGEEVFLFRFMHPPLLVPWSEIRVRSKKGWVFEYVIFTMGHELAPFADSCEAGGKSARVGWNLLADWGRRERRNGCAPRIEI